MRRTSLIVLSLLAAACQPAPTVGTPAPPAQAPLDARAYEAAPAPELRGPAVTLASPGVSGVGALFNRTEVLIAFMASSAAGDRDVYAFDREANTVLAIPAVNTPFDERDPHLSSNGRYLVYATDANDGSLDVQLYDVGRGTIDLLAELNGPGDEFAPVVDDAGQTIAFTTRAGGRDQLRLFSLARGQSYLPAALNRFRPFGVPQTTLSADGRFVAFAADVPEGRDLFAYDLASGALVEIPFVNGPGEEADPGLSGDGRHLVYADNEAGHWELRVADLLTGDVDRVPLANSPSDERRPRFLGIGSDQILFESNRSGSDQLYMFDRATGTLDTLPIPASVGTSQSLGPP